MNYNDFRRKTRSVRVGKVTVGGTAPLAVQSMTNCPSNDYEAVYAQMKALEEAGCDIVRMTVPDKEAVHTLHRLKTSDLTLPVVADIHFDYRLAIESAAAGADKIRINPGNIGGEDRVKAVVTACRTAGIPIRIGVNGGSLEKELLRKYGAPTKEALTESALTHIGLLEKYEFNDIIVAIKSSDVRTMVGAVRMLAERCDYPFHLGVTEAGTTRLGVLKSAAGIGSLLCDGIGDTLRVSLTDDTVHEVRAGYDILRACGHEVPGPELISCPTCGRTKYDMIPIAEEVERRLQNCSKPITVADMGCVVNGPGEAAAADVGIAGGLGEGLVFAKGKTLYKVPQDQLVDALMAEIEKL